MTNRLEQKINKPQASQEIAEQERLAGEFAAELRKPESGSYFKKLKSVMGALILAGLVVFSPQKVASMEMGITEERMEVERILASKDIKDKDVKLYVRIIDSLKERGGIQELHGSGRMYKSKKFATKTRLWSEIAEEKGEQPYYLKSENIFGRDFIQKNPEKTKEWHEKIEATVKATVRVVDVDWKKENYTENGFGSGVLINTKKGARILTNEHIIDKINEGSVKVELFGGGEAICKVVVWDRLKDLAVLEIVRAFGKEKKLNDSLRAIVPLEVESDNFEGKEGDIIAQIGFPLGFPRETFLNKIACTKKLEIKKGESRIYPDLEVNFLAIASKPDEKFRYLAYFETYPKDELEQKTRFKPKGGVLGGMSGGPLVDLNNKATQARISGLAAFGCDFFPKLRFFSNKRQILSVSIHAKSINEFLRENDLKD